jgi:hypothetical protein
VGKKLAERLVVELKDKLDDFAVAPAQTLRAGAAVDDVLSALVNLGYQRPAAEKAIEQAVAKEKPSPPTSTALPRRSLKVIRYSVATHQATDYSSFIFLEITSLSAEGINEHPVLGKGVGGAWAYSWRGFLDKTDNTYLSAWLLPSLIHEDTRFYAMGTGHPIPIRALYVISRQGVARTYSGHQTPNIAGLGGKVLTQLVSRNYYPTGATSFSVLAVKFGYSAMRDVAITSIREFYPDAAAHFIRKHREKMARLAAENGSSVQ